MPTLTDDQLLALYNERFGKAVDAKKGHTPGKQKEG